MFCLNCAFKSVVWKWAEWADDTEEELYRCVVSQDTVFTEMSLSWFIQNFHFSRDDSQYLILCVFMALDWNIEVSGRQEEDLSTSSLLSEFHQDENQKRCAAYKTSDNNDSFECFHHKHQCKALYSTLWSCFKLALVFMLIGDISSNLVGVIYLYFSFSFLFRFNFSVSS